MKLVFFLLPVFLLLSACGDKKEAAKAPPQITNNSSGNPITAPVDYLGAVAKAKKHSEKTLDLVAVRQAIELYHAQEDHYPKELKELVRQNFIREIPPAPYGMVYTYDPADGQVKIVAAPPVPAK